MEPWPQTAADEDAVPGLFRTVVCEVFERNLVNVTTMTRVNDDLGMDSLDVLAVRAEGSRRIGVEIEVSDLAELVSIGQCVDLALDAVARARDHVAMDHLLELAYRYGSAAGLQDLRIPTVA